MEHVHCDEQTNKYEACGRPYNRIAAPKRTELPCYFVRIPAESHRVSAPGQVVTALVLTISAITLGAAASQPALMTALEADLEDQTPVSLPAGMPNARTLTRLSFLFPHVRTRLQL